MCSRRRFVLAVSVLVGIGVLVSACGAGQTETVTVTKRHVVKQTRTVTVTETQPSTAGAATANNLTVTPDVRQAVRNAVISGEDRSLAKKTKGPLPGSMYYGEYQGVHYAVAAFDMPYTGTTDQPTLFVQLPNVPWFMPVTDLGGSPLDEAAAIPCPLRQVWDIGCAESH
jgi:hypothetical protein